jgi:hypothetical protein
MARKNIRRGTWGGVRPGAGRPTLFPGKTRRITFTLTDQTVDRAEEMAEYLGCSLSDVVEASLIEFQRHVKRFDRERR